MPMTDELLMAYADGELPPADTGKVAAAIAADPALAARVAVFTKSRQAIARAFAAEPVPSSSQNPDPMIDRIRAMARARQDAVTLDAATLTTPEIASPPAPSNVIALSQRRQVPFWQVPLAAAIALVVGLGASQLLLPSAPADGPDSVILADADLSPALDQLLSGTRQPLASGAEVTIIATFENGDGALCREFEYDKPSGVTTVAVACRTGAEWDVQLAIAADAGASGYAPASSLEALDAWLSATGAAAPLSAADETAALSDLLQ